MRLPITLATLVSISLPLAACGVADVGVTAATTAKIQAEQAKQGQQTLDKVKTDLEAAGQAQQQQLPKTDNER